MSNGFRWSEDSGLLRLQQTGGNATNADGSVVVGGGSIWDGAHGERRISAVLEEAGVDLAGLVLNASDVSADGKVIVGVGRNAAGDQVAWIARLP